VVAVQPSIGIERIGIQQAHPYYFLRVLLLRVHLLIGGDPMEPRREGEEAIASPFLSDERVMSANCF